MEDGSEALDLPEAGFADWPVEAAEKAYIRL